ncbi:SUMF1/EgtB/PvdO family nonheme iron enzyme [Myxococcota bacterium]|nr:SUMF1/EgtB/PvdO family nonheme iron enzyme [Myxococcota bacterium]
MAKKKSQPKQPPKEKQPQPPPVHGGDAHQTTFSDATRPRRQRRGDAHQTTFSDATRPRRQRRGDAHQTTFSDAKPLSSVHGGDVLSTGLADDPLRLSVHGGDALLTGGSSAGRTYQAPAEVLFGRYELLDKLGHGGMAEVWRVHDRHTKRSVALKRISGHLQANEEAQRRFFREIQLLQDLKHPHIIAIYEASPEGFFFTMELLAGRDLRQYLLERKRLPLHLALDIFGQVGRALLAAHQSGIVHRDLKPENIFLLDNPPLFVKLLDFGIAVALEGTRMTMTQQMQLGTAYYMAPEQLHGDTHAIGPAADVYSCGVLLYEIVTGRIPQIGAPSISKHLGKLEEKGLLGREEIPSELRDAFFSHLAEIEKAYQRALPSEPEDRCSLQELTSSVDARLLMWMRQREQAAAQRISAIKQSIEKGQEQQVFASLLPELVAVFSEQKVVRKFAESLVEARKERDILVASLSAKEAEGAPFWEGRAAKWQSALQRSSYGGLYRHHAFAATLLEKRRRFDAAKHESHALAETKGPIIASVAWAKTAHHFQAAQAWKAVLAEESTRQQRCEEATEALLQTLKEPWPLEALQKNLAMWDEAAKESAVARYFKEAQNQAFIEAVEEDRQLRKLQKKRILHQKMLENLQTFEVSPEKAIDEWAVFSQKNFLFDEEKIFVEAHETNLRVLRKSQPTSIFSNPLVFIRSFQDTLRFMSGQQEQKPLLFNPVVLLLWLVLVGVPIGAMVLPMADYALSPAPFWLAFWVAAFFLLLFALFFPFSWGGTFGRQIKFLREAYRKIVQDPAIAMPIFEKGSFISIEKSSRQKDFETLSRAGNLAKKGNTSSNTEMTTQPVQKEVKKTSLTTNNATVQNSKKAEHQSVPKPQIAHQAGFLKVFHVGGVDFPMRWVPAGSFSMGAPKDDGEAFENEKPHRHVTITQGYWMMETPVTQRQYLAVMGKNPSRFKKAGLEAPVENVSWVDAAVFANKLSELEGLSPCFAGSGEQMDGVGNKGSDYVGCKGWRLPTEAEWEYACRAGTTTPRYGKLRQSAWYEKNSGKTTHTVGQKQANAWGLHDTLGNVWEWCYDWYGDYPAQAATDPIGAATGSSRVGRGGGWDSHANYVRAALRSNGAPTYRYDGLGFRVVRSSP